MLAWSSAVTFINPDCQRLFVFFKFTGFTRFNFVSTGCCCLVWAALNLRWLWVVEAVHSMDSICYIIQNRGGGLPDLLQYYKRALIYFIRPVVSRGKWSQQTVMRDKLYFLVILKYIRFFDRQDRQDKWDRQNMGHLNLTFHVTCVGQLS